MKRKILTLALALLMAATLAACSEGNDTPPVSQSPDGGTVTPTPTPTPPPPTPPAADIPVNPVSDFNYAYNAEYGGVEITRYKGTNALRVRVPSEIEGQPVTSIRGTTLGRNGWILGAFHKASVMEVYLPNSIVNIGDEAFEGSDITSIVIPDSVITIGRSAFQDCVGLESVTIGTGVTSISGGAFSGTALFDNAPDGLFYVDNWLIGYKGENPTGDIVIREGTRVIANDAFFSCQEITSVTIPDSVKSIGEYAFDVIDNLSITYRGVVYTSIRPDGWEIDIMPQEFYDAINNSK